MVHKENTKEVHTVLSEKYPDPEVRLNRDGEGEVESVTIHDGGYFVAHISVEDYTFTIEGTHTPEEVDFTEEVYAVDEVVDVIENKISA